MAVLFNYPLYTPRNVMDDHDSAQQSIQRRSCRDVESIQYNHKIIVGIGTLERVRKRLVILQQLEGMW